MVKFVFINICIMSMFYAYAEKQIIELPHNFISKGLKEKIELYRTDEFYRGQNDLKNYYAHFIIPTGTIKTPLLLITGAEDPTPAWYRTVGKAIELGFKDIYIVEIRGQGLSQRVPGNKQKLIHVNNFNNYYLDFVSALKSINRFKVLEKPIYVISHSTGSMVLLKSLETLKKAIPQFKIKAMSLWAPLIKVHVSRTLDNSLVISMVSKLEKLYRSCCGLYVYKEYKRSAFSSNKLTTNLSRFSSYQQLLYKHKHGSNGLSLAWAIGVLQELRVLRKNGILRDPIPTLNLKAELDKVVSNSYTFQNRLLETQIIKGSKHSFNLESDIIFNEVTSKTFKFLLKH